MFLGLKAMWVMGESLSSQSLCSPLFCTERLQAVYCFSGMLNSKSCGAGEKVPIISPMPTHSRSQAARGCRRHSSHLLVRVGDKKVVGCWVDGEGCHRAAVGGHRAVVLKGRKTTLCPTCPLPPAGIFPSAQLQGNRRGPHTEPCLYLEVFQAVDVHLPVPADRSQPVPISARCQQVDSFPGP